MSKIKIKLRWTRKSFSISPFLFLLCLLSGCLEVALPPLKPLPEMDQAALKKLILEWEKSGPPVYKSETALTPLPPKKQLIPEMGKQNIYGITVTPELKMAYETYLGGDGEAALKALEQAEAKPNEAGMAWQISFLKAQVLIMMGRAADAEVELETASKREVAFIGHNWNARALRGEIKVWLEDYEAAKGDLLQVVQAAGNWSMPTSYGLPPGNLPQLVGVATAQIRAFAALAGVYVLKEDFPKVLLWAQEAEKKFNDVHYVTGHPLYGRFVVGHVDSYYGRAMNLVFLACAKMALAKDTKEGEPFFKRATDYFNTLGYQQGIVTLEALKARTLLLMGQVEVSLETVKTTLELARRFGLTDLVWRMQAMAGDILYKMGRETEAEEALRQAQAGIDRISGTLTTDQAKVRFGVGKEDVAQLLAKINVKKKDYARLFEDLERARGRAFVEMLAGRKLSQAWEPDLVASLQKFNKQILEQRLINTAMGDSPKKSAEREQELLALRQAELEKLRRKDPELADVLSISSKSFQQIQAGLKPGELMIYPLPDRGNERIQLFLVSTKAQDVETLNMTWNDLQTLLDRFSRSIGLPVGDQTKRGVAVKRFSAPAEPTATPAEKILKEMADRLQVAKWPAMKTIYVVPSGSFYFIPWGGLNVQSPVVVLPNGGWLIRHPHAIVTQQAISVLGDPEFGGLLPQLPGARSEAEQVASLYSIKPLIGNQATEKGLRNSIGSGVDILHLATHGLFNAKDPLNSALFMTKDGKASPLTAYDLFEKPLPARLVIMSACETGMGKITSGDDLLGLTRSFYLSGTLAILSSLWPIDDEGTKVFMEVFHQTLQKGDRGEAWLAARNALIQKGFPPSVYGAFVLGGSR
jgi:CHAT domain-containing protein